MADFGVHPSSPMAQRQGGVDPKIRILPIPTILLVAQHFNLPNHSKEHMSICGLSLHQGTKDSRENLEQRFIFQIGTLNPYGINERFSFN